MNRKRPAKRKTRQEDTTAPTPGSAKKNGVFRRFEYQLALVVCVALILRLLHLYQTRTVPSTVALIGDAKGYFLWGQRIAAGDWYGNETFYQAPLYPYFIAVVTKLFGDSVTAIRVVQSLLGTGAVALLGYTSKTLFDHRAGIIAAVMLAIMPAAIYYDGLVQKASLASFLLCLFLYWLSEIMGPKPESTAANEARAIGIDDHESPTHGATTPVASWKVFACGLTLACLMLVRENTLLWLPLPLIWFWLAHRGANTGDGRWDRKTRLVFSGVYLAGLFCVLFPVAARNASLGGEWSPTTFQAGPNFYIGNNRYANGVYSPLVPGHETPLHERSDAVRLAQQSTGREMSAREVSRFWFQKSWEDIRAAPGDWLMLLTIKSMMVINYFEVPDVESMVVYRDYSIALLMFDPIWNFGWMMVLAAAGFVLTLGDWRRLSIWYALVIVLTAAIVGFFILGRYRFPLVALLIPFAAAGVIYLMDAIRQRRLIAVAAASTMALLTAVICHLPVHDTETLNSSSFSNLGAAAAENGEMDKAMALFRRAAREAPSMPEVHVNLGRAMMASGEIENAIGELRLALSLEPNLVDADYFLGRAYEIVGDRQSAVLHYRRAVVVDPGNQAAAAAAARLGE